MSNYLADLEIEDTSARQGLSKRIILAIIVAVVVLGSIAVIVPVAVVSSSSKATANAGHQASPSMTPAPSGPSSLPPSPSSSPPPSRSTPPSPSGSPSSPVVPFPSPSVAGPTASPLSPTSHPGTPTSPSAAPTYIYTLTPTQPNTSNPTSSPTTPPTSPVVPEAGFKMAFAAVGDWGVTSDENHDSATKYGHAADFQRNFDAQVNVANSMSTWATVHKPDFVLSHGDNFYWTGISNIHDPRWQTHYEDVYGHESLFVPWYNVLGNHDIGGGSGFCGDSCWNCGYICPDTTEMAQAIQGKLDGFSNYQSMKTKDGATIDRWVFEGTYYTKKHYYPNEAEEEFSVEIFNIDTNAAGNRLPQTCCQCYSSGMGNCDNPGRGAPNCAGGDPAHYDACAYILEGWWSDSMTRLQADLAASTATWKIVHNHYLMSHFTPDQAAQVKGLLEDGGAHIFIGGHEHAEGHEFTGGVHYLENGGGGGATYKGGQGNVWLENTYGWMGGRISKDYLQILFYNDDNPPSERHCYNIPADGRDVNGFEDFKC